MSNLISDYVYIYVYIYIPFLFLNFSQSFHLYINNDKIIIPTVNVTKAINSSPCCHATCCVAREPFCGNT